MIDKEPFEGPLFIVGMPRSGTKLLRDLLNQHPVIGLPRIETHFIPHFIRKYGNPPKLNEETSLQAFFEDLSRTSFVQSMERKGYSLNGRVNDIPIPSWRGLMEPILKQFAPKEETAIQIWGDKTPSYISHMPALKSAFPAAKFVHIIRDPRDRCLSIKKTWGQSLYRAASRWEREVGRARTFGQSIREDYFEVKYEDLLDRPNCIMQDICEFLRVKYYKSIVKLERPSEAIGDAAGKASIVSGNKEKYVKELSRRHVKRIEQIVYPVMADLDYEFKHASHYRGMGAVNYYCRFLYDCFALSVFYARKKGVGSVVGVFRKKMMSLRLIM